MKFLQDLAYSSSTILVTCAFIDILARMTGMGLSYPQVVAIAVSFKALIVMSDIIDERPWRKE